MAAIVFEDPTLLESDKSLELKGNSVRSRAYVGMSNAGGCMRQNYYRFYMVGWAKHGAKTLKMFDDGHRTEKLVIDRLRLVEGLTIIERDPETFEQIECVDFNDHYRGHLDFEVLGLLQAPKTWHVGEVKCVADDKFKAFVKLRNSMNEKLVLKAWNESYYAQAQQYMHYRKRKRHYLVVASAGGRQWASVRTNYNAEDAKLYAIRAQHIIEHGDKMPERISENPAFYVCAHMCEFTDICHNGDTPRRNCRTCVWSEPIEHGRFKCVKFDQVLSMQRQIKGCDDQRFRPALINAPVEAVDEEKNSVTYRIGDGFWTDEGQ